MAILLEGFVPEAVSARDYYNISSDLNQFAVDYYPPYGSDGMDNKSQLIQVTGMNLPVDTYHTGISGASELISFFNDYYFRVHLVPNPILLGNVLETVNLAVEVWNANFVVNNLSSIINTNLDNTTLVNGLGLAAFNPLESRIYDLTVDKKGNANLNGTFTFNFGLGAVVLQIIGQRVLFFPFIPLLECKETKEFLTDIIANIGSEQNLSLRDLPRSRYNYKYLFKDIKDYNYAKNLLSAYSHIGYAVPVWTQVKYVDKGLPLGSISITIDTTNLELVVDDFVTLYKDYLTYEILEIDSFTSTSITFKRVTQTNFLNLWLIPTKLAVTTKENTFNRSANAINTLEAEFLMPSGYYSPSIAGYELYNSLPVVTKATITTGEIQEFSSRAVEYISNEIGDIDIIEVENYTRNHRIMSIYAQGQTEIFKLKRFIDYLKGRDKYFYAPTFVSDSLPINPTLPTGSSQINVSFAGFTTYNPKLIRIIGDTSIIVSVQSVVLQPDGTETINFLPVTTATVNNLKSIQILDKLRSNTDNFEILYEPLEKQLISAYVSFPAIEVN